MGQNLKKKLFGVYTLPKIVAINPRKYSNNKLNSTAANFVMTIRTENLFSDKEVKGHADFYVNGGETQPQCGNFFLLYYFNKQCSANQALKYWIEAVKSKSSNIFGARQCGSYKDFKDDKCLGNAIGYMNPKTVNTLRGKFYLKTNKDAPYAISL